MIHANNRIMEELQANANRGLRVRLPETKNYSRRPRSRLSNRRIPYRI